MKWKTRNHKIKKRCVWYRS